MLASLTKATETCNALLQLTKVVAAGLKRGCRRASGAHGGQGRARWIRTG